MSSLLRVDTAALKTLAGTFGRLADELHAGVSTLEPGPPFQPTSAAVTTVAASVDEVTRTAAVQLATFGSKLDRAATAYTETDSIAAGKLGRTVQVNRQT